LSKTFRRIQDAMPAGQLTTAAAKSIDAETRGYGEKEKRTTPQHLLRRVPMSMLFSGHARQLRIMMGAI
jgi:hypothetical protein